MAGPSSGAFDRLFRPRAVAVFGSVKRDKIAHQLIRQLTEGGFGGRILAVNPRGESPEGFADVPAHSQLPRDGGPVDLALIAVPAPHVGGVIERCGEARVPFAVVFTSGFSEAGNSEAEAALQAAARRHGVRLVGPNCAGIMDSAAGLYASIEVRALPGRTAFLTQSGAVGGAVLALAAGRGIGFSKFVSYGNRVDIGEVELLQYLESDPDTAVIALYLESLQDGRRFMQAARRVSRSKPVVIIKAGRSRSGLRAASSHTGSLAGSDRVFTAMIRQCGALRAPGMEEMLDLCDGLTSLPPLAGRRVAIVTNSGGPGILASDRAEEVGLEVPESSPELREELAELLPPHCAFANPIDLTVEGTREGYRRTLQAVLREYDGAVAINVATPFLDSGSLAEGILEARRGCPDKPLAAVFMAGEIVAEGIARLKAEGVPAFPTGERAVFVLAAMHRYAEGRRALDAAPPEEGAPGTAGPYPAGQPEEPAGLPLSFPILEPDAVAFLEREGFPFPAHAFASRAEEAAQAAGRIGFPLVMKVVSAEILHKSDVGGVQLGIESARQAGERFAGMARRFEGQQFRGTMLYRQVEGGLEMIAGVKQDPTFGPVVLAGAGGVLTELLQDSAVRIAPFDREEALRMLAELKAGPLLAGYRGGAPLDRGALADLLVRLSRLALRYPAIRELDLNPVFLLERGLAIADVRILGG